MRSTTVSDGMRLASGILEKIGIRKNGSSVGSIVTDPVIMSAIAAGVVLFIVILIVAVSRRKNKRSGTTYEPPRYDDPDETVKGTPGPPYPGGERDPDPYTTGGKGAYDEEDGLTIGGSLPVDRRFRSVSSVGSSASSGSSGSREEAGPAGGSLKKSRFSGETPKMETPKKDPAKEEIVELYTFRHRADIRICPFCDSENPSGSSTCACCGGPLSG